MVLPTDNRSYKMVFNDEESFSRNELYNRYWTKTLIDRFLKEHDSIEFSNYIGWPRYLYNKEKVLMIEDSFEFKKTLTQSVKRRGFSIKLQKKLLKEKRILSVSSF
tara:strand:+ start:425 stop:742 length:318 start_codon:yes stop_codon:yes gene_type:complete